MYLRILLALVLVAALGGIFGVPSLPGVPGLASGPTADSTVTTSISPTATQVPAGPVANGDANLRSGPGTNYERIDNVASGEPLVIVAQTAAGDWYQLDSLTLPNRGEKW